MKPLMLATLSILLWHHEAPAADLSVCIDKSSPAAAMDQRLAEAVARDQGVGLAVHGFDGSGDDEGFELKNFKILADTKCQLVLGYPVDTLHGNLPEGVKATASYGRIGFVLVTQRSSRADSLSSLPKGTDVAVTYRTTPNLYFIDHPNVEADIFQTDDETIRTLADHKVKAAMVWRPTVASYLINHKNIHDFAYHELDEPHARWDLVGLYGVDGAETAARFEQSVSNLRGSGELERILTPYATMPPKPVVLASAASVVPVVAPAASGSPPALYTADQAVAGKQKFADNCSQCHGDNLEGMSGPALRGKLFAPPKANFHVGDIFTIVSQNMPATQPASLPHDDYVQIMAYILQQNGYPAGSTPLSFEGATTSKTMLIYNGN